MDGSCHLAIFRPNILFFFIRLKTYGDWVERETRENKKAFALKEKGNDAFKRKEYEVAEKFYLEGIRTIYGKSSFDARPLWTNLAICENILGKHEDALQKCKSALRIDPKCAKAGFQSEF